MIRSGAHGYISKNAPKTEMLQAIRGVLRGKTYISTDVQARMAEALADEASGEGALHNLEKLTEKEKEIMRLVQQGLTSKEIARQMNISYKTVQVHRHNILKKLNLKNTASLLHFINTNNLFN
ncbi:MAG: response regulator transcription factor [Lacibacter sp.]|jgi:RNA polymerase sigma factor (sigma-70 family)